MMLEQILQPKLHLPVVNHSRADAPKVGCAQIAAGSIELRRIQEIERFIPELQFVAFANPEFLEQRKIPGLLARSVEQADTCVSVAFRTQIDPVARTSIALRPHKSPRIEPAVERAAFESTVDLLARNNIRTRSARCAGVLGIASLADCYRQPGL